MQLERLPSYPPPAPPIMASSSSASASPDRFEYNGHVVVASQLESRLATHALVRDCAVIGVAQPNGMVTTTSSHSTMAHTLPMAFVALSASGRERSALGGDKESRRMKAQLTKHLVEAAPLLKTFKLRLMFVESIPRSPTGSILRHLLVDKATMPPAPGPDKGFFNTVLAQPSTSPKKGVRDSKRRATHSQIERRRREKINDRLVTLRCIVPACAQELADRRRQKQEDEDEAARIAAGGAPKTYIDAATGKPKRKRNRKRADSKKAAGEDELGLHKLDVLTHAINYIFELKAQIHTLQTGERPQHVPTADNPFGVRNADGSYRQDAKIEDVDENQPNDDDEEEEEEEEDEIEASDDEPLSKRIRDTDLRSHYTHRSSSSGASTDISPSFSLIHASPSAISPATTTMSPMMSLAAESPILLPDAAMPLPKRGRESISLLKHLSLASPRGAMGPSYGEQSEVRSKTPGLADARDAAELLLNFSTSPEVLRPPRGGLASPPLLALDAPQDPNKSPKDGH